MQNLQKQHDEFVAHMEKILQQHQQQVQQQQQQQVPQQGEAFLADRQVLCAVDFINGSFQSHHKERDLYLPTSNTLKFWKWKLLCAFHKYLMESCVCLLYGSIGHIHKKQEIARLAF